MFHWEEFWESFGGDESGYCRMVPGAVYGGDAVSWSAEYDAVVVSCDGVGFVADCYYADVGAYSVVESVYYDVADVYVF